MKRLLIILLLPITVYAATPLYGSSTTVVENWKGEFISEDVLVDDLMMEQADELISTQELVDDTTSDYMEEEFVDDSAEESESDIEEYNIEENEE